MFQIKSQHLYSVAAEGSRLRDLGLGASMASPRQASAKSDRALRSVQGSANYKRHCSTSSTASISLRGSCPKAAKTGWTEKSEDSADSGGFSIPAWPVQSCESFVPCGQLLAARCIPLQQPESPELSRLLVSEPWNFQLLRDGSPSSPSWLGRAHFPSMLASEFRISFKTTRFMHAC